MILKDNVKVIAFDADDTLWENQPYYDDAGGGNNPVLQIGGYGVYIPFHTTWQHEQTEEFEHPKLFRLARFEDLCGIL